VSAGATAQCGFTNGLNLISLGLISLGATGKNHKMLAVNGRQTFFGY
jgi:hypothetical protein